MAVSLPPDVYQLLKERAAHQGGRSISSIVREALMKTVRAEPTELRVLPPELERRAP